jgi:hypothetical protein
MMQVSQRRVPGLVGIVLMTAVILSFHGASARSSLAVAQASTPAVPPGYPTPTLIEQVPVPGIPPGAVQVRLRAADDSYGPLPAGCLPNDVVAILNGFIDAFNRGDQAALATYLAEDTVGPTMAMGGDFAWFSVSGAPGSFNPGGGGDTPGQALAYFAERHRHGERMQLLQLELGTTWWENGIGMTFDVARDADDIPAHIAGGKGAIDCARRKITLWSLGDRPVLPDSSFGTPIPAETPAS